MSFRLPESVALIEDGYTSPESDAPLVFLFQDAHTNDSGQLNLAKALQEVIEKEGVAHVFSEGSQGDMSLNDIKHQYSQESIRPVADSYLRKGLLKGEELLNLTSSRDFKILGVEDKALYLKSLKTFREVSENRRKTALYLDRVRRSSETLKKTLYSQELQALDRKRTSYLEEETPLTDYFESLYKEAKRLGVYLSPYKNLLVLRRLKHLEARIDFEKASREQEEAIRSLSPEDREELSSSHAPLRLKNNDAFDRAFYSLLQEKISPSRHYQELAEYFHYLKISKKLNAFKTLEEISGLEEDVFSRLTPEKDQRLLWIFSRNLETLTKILDLKATPDEFKRYQKDMKDFDIKAISGFFNKKILDLRKHYDQTLLLSRTYEKVSQKAQEFYELTYQRDAVFLDRLARQMGENGISKAALITGGFHTPHLKELLRQKNISYVSILPQVLYETDQARYERILLNQFRAPAHSKSPSAKPAVAATLRTFALADPHNVLGGMQAKQGFVEAIVGRESGAVSAYPIAAARLAQSVEADLQSLVDRLIADPTGANLKALKVAAHKLIHPLIKTEVISPLEALAKARKKKNESEGRYKALRVLAFSVEKSGKIHRFEKPKVMRDKAHEKIIANVLAHPELFPDGMDSFPESDKPFYQVGGDQFLRLLRVKLKEERLPEVLKADGKSLIRELADLIEVAEAIAELDPGDWDITAVRLARPGKSYQNLPHSEMTLGGIIENLQDWKITTADSFSGAPQEKVSPEELNLLVQKKQEALSGLRKALKIIRSPRFGDSSAETPGEENPEAVKKLVTGSIADIDWLLNALVPFKREGIRTTFLRTSTGGIAKIALQEWLAEFESFTSGARLVGARDSRKERRKFTEVPMEERRQFLGRVRDIIQKDSASAPYLDLDVKRAFISYLETDGRINFKLTEFRYFEDFEDAIVNAETARADREAGIIKMTTLSLKERWLLSYFAPMPGRNMHTRPKSYELNMRRDAKKITAKIKSALDENGRLSENLPSVFLEGYPSSRPGAKPEFAKELSDEDILDWIREAIPAVEFYLSNFFKKSGIRPRLNADASDGTGIGVGTGARLAIQGLFSADDRPSEAGLLDPLFVMQDMLIREQVNPDGKPLKVLYAGSGADASHVLLSTDADEIYFADMLVPDLKNYEDLWGMSALMAREYARIKKSAGFGMYELLNSPLLPDYFLFELRALGVKLEDIKKVELSERGGTDYIEFDWAYQGGKKRTRRIHFIRADVSKPEEYPARLLKVLAEGFDVYYQRAALNMPDDHANYMGLILDALRPGGFVIADEPFDAIFKPLGAEAQRLIARSKLIRISTEMIDMVTDQLKDRAKEIFYRPAWHGSMSVANYGLNMQMWQKGTGGPKESEGARLAKALPFEVREVKVLSAINQIKNLNGSAPIFWLNGMPEAEDVDSLWNHMSRGQKEPEFTLIVFSDTKQARPRPQTLVLKGGLKALSKELIEFLSSKNGYFIVHNHPRFPARPHLGHRAKRYPTTDEWYARFVAQGLPAPFPSEAEGDFKAAEALKNFRHYVYTNQFGYMAFTSGENLPRSGEEWTLHDGAGVLDRGVNVLEKPSIEFLKSFADQAEGERHNLINITDGSHRSAQWIRDLSWEQMVEQRTFELRMTGARLAGASRVPLADLLEKMVRYIERAEEANNDLTSLIAEAKKVQPDFKTSLKSSRSVDYSHIFILFHEISSQIFMPRDYVFVFYPSEVGSREPQYLLAQVDPDSWANMGNYLGTDIRLADMHIISGPPSVIATPFDERVFVDVQASRADSLEFYRQIDQGIVTESQFPALKRLKEKMTSGLLDPQTYYLQFGQMRKQYEQIESAKNSIYLRRWIRSLYKEDPMEFIARHGTDALILEPYLRKKDVLGAPDDSSFRKLLRNPALQDVSTRVFYINSIVTYASSLKGLISEMEAHLERASGNAHDAEKALELAYAAFLDYLTVQNLEYERLHGKRGPPSVNGLAASHLVNGMHDLHPEIMNFQNIIDWAESGPEHAARKALALLKEVYYQDFWNDGERKELLEKIENAGSRLATRREFLGAVIATALVSHRAVAEGPAANPAIEMDDFEKKYDWIDLRDLRSLWEADPKAGRAVLDEVAEAFRILNATHQGIGRSGMVDPVSLKIKFTVAFNAQEQTVAADFGVVLPEQRLPVSQVRDVLWRRIVSDNLYLPSLSDDEQTLWNEMSGEGDVKRGLEIAKRRLRDRSLTRKNPGENTELNIERSFRTGHQFKIHLAAALGLPKSGGPNEKLDATRLQCVRAVLAKGKVSPQDLQSAFFGRPEVRWPAWTLGLLGSGGLGYYAWRAYHKAKAETKAQKEKNPADPQGPDSGARLSAVDAGVAKPEDGRVLRSFFFLTGIEIMAFTLLIEWAQRGFTGSAVLSAVFMYLAFSVSRFADTWIHEIGHWIPAKIYQALGQVEAVHFYGANHAQPRVLTTLSDHFSLHTLSRFIITLSGPLLGLAAGTTVGILYVYGYLQGQIYFAFAFTSWMSALYNLLPSGTGDGGENSDGGNLLMILNFWLLSREVEAAYPDITGKKIMSFSLIEKGDFLFKNKDQIYVARPKEPLYVARSNNHKDSPSPDADLQGVKVTAKADLLKTKEDLDHFMHLGKSYQLFRLTFPEIFLSSGSPDKVHKGESEATSDPSATLQKLISTSQIVIAASYLILGFLNQDFGERAALSDLFLYLLSPIFIVAGVISHHLGQWFAAKFYQVLGQLQAVRFYFEEDLEVKLWLALSRPFSLSMRSLFIIALSGPLTNAMIGTTIYYLHANQFLQSQAYMLFASVSWLSALIHFIHDSNGFLLESSEALLLFWEIRESYPDIPGTLQAEAGLGEGEFFFKDKMGNVYFVRPQDPSNSSPAILYPNTSTRIVSSPLEMSGERLMTSAGSDHFVYSDKAYELFRVNLPADPDIFEKSKQAPKDPDAAGSRLAAPVSRTMIYPAPRHDIWAVREMFGKFREIFPGSELSKVVLVDKAFFDEYGDTPNHLIRQFELAGFKLDLDDQDKLKRHDFSKENRLEMAATLGSGPGQGRSVTFVLYNADYLDPELKLQELGEGFALTLIKHFDIGVSATHPAEEGNSIYGRAFAETAVNGLVYVTESYLPRSEIVSRNHSRFLTKESRRKDKRLKYGEYALYQKTGLQPETLRGSVDSASGSRLTDAGKSSGSFDKQGAPRFDAAESRRILESPEELGKLYIEAYGSGARVYRWLSNGDFSAQIVTKRARDYGFHDPASDVYRKIKGGLERIYANSDFLILPVQIKLGYTRTTVGMLFERYNISIPDDVKSDDVRPDGARLIAQRPGLTPPYALASSKAPVLDSQILKAFLFKVWEFNKGLLALGQRVELPLLDEDGKLLVIGIWAEERAGQTLQYQVNDEAPVSLSAQAGKGAYETLRGQRPFVDEMVKNIQILNQDRADAIRALERHPGRLEEILNLDEYFDAHLSEEELVTHLELLIADRLYVARSVPNKLKSFLNSKKLDSTPALRKIVQTAARNYPGVFEIGLPVAPPARDTIRMNLYADSRGKQSGLFNLRIAQASRSAVPRWSEAIGAAVAILEALDVRETTDQSAMERFSEIREISAERTQYLQSRYFAEDAELRSADFILQIHGEIPYSADQILSFLPLTVNRILESLRMLLSTVQTAA